MQEFESISASSYDPSALATKLTAKAADGWSVVAIVPTGGDVTAFLSRDKSGTDGARSESSAAGPDSNRDDEIAPFVLAANNSSAASETISEERPDTTSEAVSEPAGWAIAPEAAAGAAAAATTPTLAGSGSSAIGGQSATESAPVAAAAPVAAVAAAPAAAPDPAPAPAVPAGWYADPAGRFELRYWDGTTWTEHVSRSGQQFTDPPVA
jgi:hypothetical protein